MPQDINELLTRTNNAYKKYRDYTQEQVDKIVTAVAITANKNRLFLAKIAFDETQMGVFEDKVIKVHFAAEYVLNKYRNEKTCGIVESDNIWGTYKIFDSMGIVAAIAPCTNPTSTVVFKTLLALKTRNAIIFAPHPRAKKCSVAAVKLLLDAAVAAGAPQDIIGCIEEPTIELTTQLMHHPFVAIILATGGPALVKAAYSSGKPAIGVGAGNTPTVVDETADIPMTVTSILISKTFDNGTVCASEQSIVAVKDIYEKLKTEFTLRGAHILSEEERQKLGAVLVINKALNPKVVGQAAYKIAQLANIEVPQSTKVLIAEINEVGPNEPFSYEKLSPVLGLYCEENFEAAVNTAEKLIEFGGMGHTSCLYTNEKNQERIKYFGEKLKTVRILINIPGAQGAIGDIYNFKLDPSLTLGCGSYGGNSVSGNIEIKHLLNTKTITERRENMLWFKIPPQIYFKYGCLTLALHNLAGYKRALIITDSSIISFGYLRPIIETLKAMGLAIDIFRDIQPDPDFQVVLTGIKQAKIFKPDVIIAIGGGSPIDAAKIMWLMYDYPEIEFDKLAMRFMDIEKRIYSVVKDTPRTFFVAIPTTSGTGSEVTPFAVITKDGVKYPIADYSITPNMAILDPFLVMNMPKSLTAIGGFDAIVHGLEAFVAVTATDYTNALAKESLRILFKYLPTSFHEGNQNLEAREKVHYAANMAGMAFANAYLGICHSMAHKLGAAFNIPHGTANALLILQVIRYNASPSPTKFATFPQYRIPLSSLRYAKIADLLELGGNNDEEKVELLVKKLIELKKELEFPDAIKDLGITEKDFLDKVDALSELAFDDQCTGTNPRYPLISEIRELYLKAYHGDTD